MTARRNARPAPQPQVEIETHTRKTVRLSLPIGGSHALRVSHDSELSGFVLDLFNEPCVEIMAPVETVRHVTRDELRDVIAGLQAVIDEVSK